MDTTANTTKYLLRNFPACGVDCFGSICPMGNSLISGEDKESTELSLKALCLNNRGANCGTDRALGWKEPLVKNGINHFYDTWHFSQNALKIAGGRSSSAVDFIKKSMKQCIMISTTRKI